MGLWPSFSSLAIVKGFVSKASFNERGQLVSWSFKEFEVLIAKPKYGMGSIRLVFPLVSRRIGFM